MEVVGSKKDSEQIKVKLSYSEEMTVHGMSMDQLKKKLIVPASPYNDEFWKQIATHEKTRTGKVGVQLVEAFEDSGIKLQLQKSGFKPQQKPKEDQEVDELMTIAMNRYSD